MELMSCPDGTGREKYGVVFQSIGEISNRDMGEGTKGLVTLLRKEN